MEFWTVLEIQVLDGGAKGALSTAYDDENQALSAYYSILAAGAINGIPYHAAYLINSKSGVRKSNVYDRSESNG